MDKTDPSLVQRCRHDPRWAAEEIERLHNRIITLEAALEPPDQLRSFDTVAAMMKDLHDD